MDEDLKTLGAEIRACEHDLRACERRLLKHKRKAEEEKEPVPEDLGVSLELCRAARAEARRHARAPFDPPALKRHEGLERVARATTEARRKKGGLEEPREARRPRSVRTFRCYPTWHPEAVARETVSCETACRLPVHHPRNPQHSLAKNPAA